MSVDVETARRLVVALQRVNPDYRDEFISTLLPAELAALREVLAATKRASAPPDDASLMHLATVLDDKYRIRPHTQHIADIVSDALRDVEQGTSRRIIVSLPPRTGKSTLTSFLFPLWLLRQHPDWPIVLASHEQSFATSFSRQIRRTFNERPDLGVDVSKESSKASEWETTSNGVVIARGVHGSLTGRGARVMVIDDPVKNFAEAHSAVARDALWDWWLSVAYTRLEAPYLVLLPMCLTGDTLVTLADGTQREIRDVRAGDEIATYEDGRITTTRVERWASQGYDYTYRIKMSSGTTVRSNARHPFLTVDDNGETSWTRAKDLTSTSRIVRANGVSGSASHAQSTTAATTRSVAACACRTTTKRDGLPESDLPPTTQERAERQGSSAGTGSRSKTTSACAQSNKGAALSASSRQTNRTRERTGTGNSASTTITTQEKCESCCATTATSPSATERQRSDSAPLQTTSNVTVDDVIEVEQTGMLEEVFDIQVERTENFIANDLVTHNTRWHEDDIVGRLLSTDYPGDPDDWTVIRIPAVAEHDDPLGREEGAPLLSPLTDETEDEAMERWDEVQAAVGSYVWAGLYQQRPSPAKGTIFDMDWWKFWTTRPDLITEDSDDVVLVDPRELERSKRTVESWDMAFKGKDDSDYVVGQLWARVGPRRYLLKQTRDRMTFTKTLSAMLAWADLHPSVNLRLVEDKANGTAVIDTLKRDVAGLIPVNPTDSKEGRARAVSPEVEAGDVYLPHPVEFPWVTELLDELRSFPRGTNDDQVDALTQALDRLGDGGQATMTSPAGRRKTSAQRPQNTLTSKRLRRGR